MYQGSTFLLTRSPRTYIPLVEWIDTCDPGLWTIDVDDYSSDNIALLVEAYEDIRKALCLGKRAHSTLVTKIMMGISGNVPAYDRFFRIIFADFPDNNLGFSPFNGDSL